jgi:hypothetical protein
MRPQLRNPKRFSSPTILDENAPFFGATIKEWDQALTGGLDKTLAELKRRTSIDGKKRDASSAQASDLASAVGKRLTGAE